ncbi:uncharacterized protein LOC111906496 isoform X6 [Lactuca sativa]|uniref:uncharacterized protein LOC111906496 isoform X6 n=1 Tax=Lactuca sativa TaxID=4236 RepID=UPI001C690A8A|nr:uncharacterized protein LOC111906496 isoform X6 [Lactuca sativa]
MRTGTNNSLFRTGLLLYVSTRGLSPQQAQAHENSKAFTLVTLHTNRTASNSSRKIRRWCSPQQKFTTQIFSTSGQLIAPRSRCDNVSRVFAKSLFQIAF